MTHLEKLTPRFLDSEDREPKINGARVVSLRDGVPICRDAKTGTRKPRPLTNEPPWTCAPITSGEVNAAAEALGYTEEEIIYLRASRVKKITRVALPEYLGWDARKVERVRVAAQRRAAGVKKKGKLFPWDYNARGNSCNPIRSQENNYELLRLGIEFQEIMKAERVQVTPWDPKYRDWLENAQLREAKEREEARKIELARAARSAH